METVENAGIRASKLLVMVNTKMFRHPKYYKELRKRNKSDQVISANKRDGGMKVRAPGPGLKHQVSWSMHALTNRSHRLQATRVKLQATSDKLK